MEIGIGLPAAIPGVTGATLAAWARRAEGAGFSTLATVDRIVYANFEPLATLAAAAAVTGRIRLTTSVLLAPLRANAALLAKQIATVDQLSAGRLVVGLSVGSRPDDFTASGIEMSGRGKRLDHQIEVMRDIWAGRSAATVGPRPVRPGGPPIILGGHAPAVFARAARRADGWISGSGGPEAFRRGAQEVGEHWRRLARPGRPRLLALAYYALGPDAGPTASAYLRDYYRFAGPFVERVVAGAAVSQAAVTALADQYAQAGCDELILMPCVADLAQVDLLRDAVQIPGVSGVSGVPGVPDLPGVPGGPVPGVSGVPGAPK